jgi:hypothetical protein
MITKKRIRARKEMGSRDSSAKTTGRTRVVKFGLLDTRGLRSRRFVGRLFLGHQSCATSEVVGIVSSTLAPSTTLAALALMLHVRGGAEHADSSLIWAGPRRGRLQGGIGPRLVGMHNIRHASNAIPWKSKNHGRIMGDPSGGAGVIGSSSDHVGSGGGAEARGGLGVDGSGEA